MADKEEYDWLEDPFNDRKNQKPQGGCSGIAVIAVVLVVVLVIVLGFFIISSIGAITDIYSS